MILFILKCGKRHEFEAWFRDNAAYDRQHARNLIVCPDCGSHAVEKAPMAPRLGRSHKSSQEAPVENAAPVVSDAEPAANLPAPDADATPTPAQVRRALQVLRRHVEKNCEDVGSRFAEEARRMHKGDAKARGIYGEATPTDAKALIDDGIEIASIPWVPSSDA